MKVATMVRQCNDEVLQVAELNREVRLLHSTVRGTFYAIEV